MDISPIRDGRRHALKAQRVVWFLLCYAGMGLSILGDAFGSDISSETFLLIFTVISALYYIRAPGERSPSWPG